MFSGKARKQLIRTRYPSGQYYYLYDASPQNVRNSVNNDNSFKIQSARYNTSRQINLSVDAIAGLLTKRNKSYSIDMYKSKPSNFKLPIIFPKEPIFTKTFVKSPLRTKRNIQSMLYLINSKKI